MSLRRFLLTSAFVTSGLIGCAHKPATPPDDKPAAAAPAPAAPAPAPAETPAPTPAPAAEAVTTPPAPTPECTSASDCDAKGAASEGNQWACTDSKCTEEKKPAHGKKKKGKK